MEILSRGCF